MIDFEKLRIAFAYVLKKRRCAKKLSQVDLAAASGVADSYISRLEKGDRMPSIDIVFRLSVPLGVSPETLMKEIRFKFNEIDKKRE